MSRKNWCLNQEFILHFNKMHYKKNEINQKENYNRQKKDTSQMKKKLQN